MELARAETFEPVVAIEHVAEDEEEAHRRANDTSSPEPERLDRPRSRHHTRPADPGRHGERERGLRGRLGVARRTDGGHEEDPGLGRRHGPEGLLKYTDPQTVAVQRLVPIGPMPSETYAKVMTAGARGGAAGEFPSCADRAQLCEGSRRPARSRSARRLDRLVTHGCPGAIGFRASDGGARPPR